MSSDKVSPRVAVKVEYEDNTEQDNQYFSSYPQSSTHFIAKTEETYAEDKCLISSSGLAKYCDSSVTKTHSTSCYKSCYEGPSICVKTEPIEFGENALGASLGVTPTPNGHGLNLDNKDIIRSELEYKTGILNIDAVIVMDNQENAVTEADTQSQACSTDSNDTNVNANHVPKIAPISTLSLKDFKVGSLHHKKFLKRKLTDNGKEILTILCNKCEFETQSSMIFKHHYKKNHVLDLYPCYTCCKLYFVQNSLRIHNRRFHRASNKFPCFKCDLTFDSYLKFRSHLRSKHGKKVFKCNQCEYYQSDRRSRLVSHIRKNHKTPLICAYCDKNFDCIAELTRHQMLHTGERHYVCEFCGFRTKKSSTLKKHEVTFHSKHKDHACSSGETVFLETLQCQICPFTTPSWTNFTDHLVQSHPKNKPFQCGQCLKYFCYHTSLIRHKNGTKGRCLRVKHETGKMVKKGNQTKSVQPKTKRGPSVAKMMAKDLVACQACNEQFPTLKVLKRHLKYCVFNS